MNPGSGMEAKDGQPQSCPRPSTGQAKVAGASFLGVIPEPYDNVAQKNFYRHVFGMAVARTHKQCDRRLLLRTTEIATSRDSATQQSNFQAFISSVLKRHRHVLCKSLFPLFGTVTTLPSSDHTDDL
ncbi:aldose 1-epimerase family protein [Aspergillus luchuensis]|uniref:Aldose 1-epimerase family protein n=1 Tax=Aspergillus kawachii TaxID=1069201 RepID=A0A146EYG9_ASPKA|nr:aldose 1-epimerase family protein [Aspergillus luchuensis]